MRKGVLYFFHKTHCMICFQILLNFIVETNTEIHQHILHFKIKNFDLKFLLDGCLEVVELLKIALR